MKKPPSLPSITLALPVNSFPSPALNTSLPQSNQIKSLMFRRTAFAPKRAHGRDVGLEALLLGAVGAGRQLDERVQRDLHPGALLLRDVHVVGVDAAEDGLVRDDDDVLAALELHDDGLQPDDHVAVRLPAPITVVVLVVVARLEVLRVAVRDLLVREAVAEARVQLVQRLPFELVVALWGRGEEAGRLDRAFEGRGPDGELAVIADGGGDEVGERLGVEFAAFGDVGVAADFAVEVVLGFAVLNGCQCGKQKLERKGRHTLDSQIERGRM